MTGTQKTLGSEKPRCLVCIVSTKLKEEGFEFLPTFKGLEHIHRVEAQRELSTWSLMEFFAAHSRNHFPKPRLFDEILALPLPHGQRVRLTGTHRGFDRYSVWTAGEIQFL